MKITGRKKMLAATAALACGLALGIGSPALAAGTVNVGLSTVLTGPAAGIGMANKIGAEMAIDQINAHGGLLGEKIHLLTADGQAKPNLGVTNVRHFILADQAKAIFGPLSSAVGIAEEGVAAQYRVPIFFTISTDVVQTGKAFTKYAFQMVPSTYMEPHAMAIYVADLFKKHHWKTVYTISPNYAFGHAAVTEFLAGLKQEGVDVKVVGEQWPQLGTTDFTRYLSAIMATHPDFVFGGIFGGDLITFTKQAEGSGFFKTTPFLSYYMPVVLNALGASAPAGALTDDRAPPFYMVHSKEMQQFVDAFHAKYHRWPGTWEIQGYAGVQVWAQGVEKARSFDADKVAAALSGATVKTIRGDFKLRACDHLAEIPVYMGTLSKEVNQKYGRRVMADIVAEPPEKIMMSCAAKVAMQPHH